MMAVYGTWLEAAEAVADLVEEDGKGPCEAYIHVKGKLVYMDFCRGEALAEATAWTDDKFGKGLQFTLKKGQTIEDFAAWVRKRLGEDTHGNEAEA